MDQWLNSLIVESQRYALRIKSVASIISLMAACGCGGASSSTPDTVSENQSTSTVAADGSSGNVSTTQPEATDHVRVGATGTEKHGRNEVWIDEKGQKWFGNVPMDAFFDQPYTVASDATSVGGSSAATAVAATTVQGNASPGDAGAGEKPQSSASTAEPVSAASSGSDGWAQLISETELENEVKSIRNFLNENLQSVSNYNSSMLMIPPKAATLGALAGIAMEYPVAVSWKDDAKYIRNLSKQMNSDTLRSGPKDQKRLLGLYEAISDTLNRSKPAGLEEPPESDGFAEVSEMRLLMHRMEEAEKRMKTEAGTDGALASRKDMVVHEASVMAALTKIVSLPGYGYEDDAKFREYANDVIKASLAIKTAAEANDFATYELSLSKLSTTCSNCHSDYKNN